MSEDGGDWQHQRDLHADRAARRDDIHRTAMAAAELAVTVGRLDERLASIHRALEKHMREEHADFVEALKKVDALTSTVADLHAAARVTRWIAGVASGLVAVIVWMRNHVTFT